MTQSKKTIRRKNPKKTSTETELSPAELVVNQEEARPQFNPEDELRLIKKALGHPLREFKTRHWLDTRDEDANAVFGSPTLGLPCGIIYEISGFESHGKTAIAYGLAGLAQEQGVRAAVWDLELAWDPGWATKRGMRAEETLVFKPYVAKFSGEKEERLITAQEQVEEIEEWMKLRYAADPEGKIFLIVDSIAAMETQENLEAGVQGQNMRTKVSVPTFLSWLLPRWQKFAVSYNAWIILINQMRVKPGIAFGNPEYSPGGNALRHYCSIRLKARRKGKKILKNGQPIGFKGVIQNWKNKAGGGSHEGAKVGFKMLYDGRMKFVPESEIKSEAEE